MHVDIIVLMIVSSQSNPGSGTAARCDSNALASVHKRWSADALALVLRLVMIAARAKREISRRSDDVSKLLKSLRSKPGAAVYSGRLGIAGHGFSPGNGVPAKKISTLEELEREFEVARVQPSGQAVDILREEGMLQGAPRGLGTFCLEAKPGPGTGCSSRPTGTA